MLRHSGEHASALAEDNEKKPPAATPEESAEAWKAPDANDVQDAKTASASNYLPTIEPHDEVTNNSAPSLTEALLRLRHTSSAAIYWCVGQPLQCSDMARLPWWQHRAVHLLPGSTLIIVAVGPA